MIRLAFLLLVVACAGPTKPSCVELMRSLDGRELPADSLETEGWIVLEGDTVAVLEVDCP